MHCDKYLQLVLSGLGGWGWVEEIDCQNLTNLSVLHIQMMNNRRLSAPRWRYCHSRGQMDDR